MKTKQRLPYIPPAEILRAARERLGLTRAQAAKACGVSWAEWWRWETAKKVPRAVAEKLAALERAARKAKAG